MKVIERFDAYIKKKGLSLNSVDNQLEMGNAYIGKQIRKKASIGSDVIEKIVSIFPDLNIYWLIAGKGEMLVNDLPANREPNVPAYSRKKIKEEMNLMPVVDIKAAADYKTGYIVDGYIETLDTMVLPTSLIGYKKHYVFQNWGDSMHPTLYDGDYVAASFVDTGDWLNIRDNSIYVIVSKSRGVNIKRIKNRITQHGFIRCRSDNRHHPAFNVEVKDILQLWQVACKVSFNLPNENENIYNKVDFLEERIEKLEQQKIIK